MPNSRPWGNHIFAVFTVTRPSPEADSRLMNRWLRRNTKRIRPISLSTTVWGGNLTTLTLFYERIETDSSVEGLM